MKTVLWHFIAESGRSCSLLRFFTFRPFPFHTPPAASESCALFIFAGLIYKEVAYRCVQARRKGLKLRCTEKPYMVEAEEFFKPFLILNLFSLAVVEIVVTIRLYVHIGSH